MPAGITPVQQRKTSDDHSATSTPDFTKTLEKLGYAYTDGSGGPNWLPKGAKTTGSAVATMRLSSEPGGLKVHDDGISTSSTPGRQTVPRAEVWAAIMTAQAATCGQQISLHIDAAYLVKGIQQVHKHEALRGGANGDLWDTLIEFIEAKKLTPTALTS